MLCLPPCTGIRFYWRSRTDTCCLSHKFTKSFQFLTFALSIAFFCSGKVGKDKEGTGEMNPSFQDMAIAISSILQSSSQPGRYCENVGMEREV